MDPNAAGTLWLRTANAGTECGTSYGSQGTCTFIASTTAGTCHYIAHYRSAQTYAADNR